MKPSQQYVTICFALLSFADVAATECKLKADVTCTIKDTRKEFEAYYNMPCNKFQSAYKIDKQMVKNGAYTGEKNPNGYPLIKVTYEWKVCNKNENETLILNSLRTAAVLNNDKQTILNVAGRMKAGKCRKASMITVMNSESKYHAAASRIAGFRLESNDYCYAHKYYKTRLQYTDDCKLEAYTNCFLVNREGLLTAEPCKTGIKRFSNNETDCNNVQVAFQWKICNGEDFTIFVEESLSKLKLNGKVSESIAKELESKKCEIRTNYASINTCDSTTKTMSAFVKGIGNGRKCRDYNFHKFEVADAVPSASPSFTPSWSILPSSAPTVSHKPSITSQPSSVPSFSPSSRPTSRPTATPSVGPSASSSPTPEPSPVPTRNLSTIPTANPTFKSSRSPTSYPTRLLDPSSKPSFICEDSIGKFNVGFLKKTMRMGSQEIDQDKV